MNQKNNSSSSASPVNAEAIQTLANIYLSSAERLAELNLNVIREVLKESVSATKGHHGKGNDNESAFTQASFLQPIIEQSMSYSRNAFAILVETQQKAIKTLMSQFASGGANYMPADWNSSLEMLNKGAQQFSTLATQGASATDEVARKASETFTKAIKAA